MRYLFLFILTLPFFAHAESYYWSGANSQHASSAQAACLPSVGGFALSGVSMSGATSGTCTYSGTNSSGNTVSIDSGVVNRYGDACPSGANYNAVSGTCEAAPLPENKCSSSKGNNTPNYSWHQESAELPAPKIDIDGCSATTGEISSCLAMSTGGFTCVGDITITGDLFVPPPTTTQPTTPINPTTPSPTPDPTGGTSGGGTGSNGGETGTGTNPGTGTGSGTGTGTGTNPGTGTGGGTGSGSGSGSGSSPGSGSGSGSSSGNGSGSTGGSGSTPGTGSGSGTSPGTGTSGEGTCEKDCDENGPTTTSLKAPQQGSLDGEGEKWDDKIAQSKGDIKKGLDDLKSVFSPIGDISLSGGGTLYCPAPVTVLNRSISFCLNKYADSLSWISSAVMALSSVIALLIVFG
ncbi:hypothetical protein ALQ71_200162 [Pseudomonas coronafaciens pv. striafaciens]|uniref:hypothetical protein n=1 Tax=Pseudomonas coronafaciens TaxID=53409 RepID=UPI000F3DF392|nr:hypothetical protein [Pseudomonas coronafaciens]RMM82949.1 hypothetical protein ALQ71_200162 [Pseudomonas coronafaciens pv. striafaciens]